jgi:hypothetical protein
MKKPFVPFPDSWEDVAIIEPDEDEPQLDLFAERPCNQSADKTQSPQRLR